MQEIRQKILLVGDDPAQLDILRSALQKFCEIAIASSAQQTVQIAESAPFPELILLDTLTPELDVYKLCRQLRQNSTTQMIPIILLTDAHENFDATELGSGAVDYLIRPFNATHVAARVKSHLRLSAITNELKEHDTILSEYARMKDVIDRLCKYDFKSPIKAFIDVPAQLIRELSMNTQQIEELNCLSQSASSLLTVISRSIDLYKMEKGTYLLIPVSVDLVKVIKQIFREHKRLAEKKGVRFAVNINQKPASANDSFEMRGEEGLFFLMLTDLIKKAIEASPENKEVVIDLNNSPHPTIAIKIAGASPELCQEQIRHTPASSDKEPHANRWFHLAKLALNNMEGDLSCSASATEGTTILISLPADNLSEDAATLQKNSSDIKMKAAKQKPKAETRILIADDYAFMRKHITGILQKSGYPMILEADDGNAAIRLLETGNIDLILCDWEMPMVTGLEVLRHMLSKDVLKNTPFIMVTASSALSELEIALENGVQHFIVKPFSPDILRKKVEAVLAKSHGEEPSR